VPSFSRLHGRWALLVELSVGEAYRLRCGKKEVLLSMRQKRARSPPTAFIDIWYHGNMITTNDIGM
jgi:hypothetical protein